MRLALLFECTHHEPHQEPLEDDLLLDVRGEESAGRERGRRDDHERGEHEARDAEPTVRGERGKPCRGDEQRERECEHRRGGERDLEQRLRRVARFSSDHVGERDVGEDQGGEHDRCDDGRGAL